MGRSRDPGEPLTASALWTPCRVCVMVMCASSPGIWPHFSKSPSVVIKLIVVQELDLAVPLQCVRVSECVCVCLHTVYVCLSIELSVAQSTFPASSVCLFLDKEINRRVDSSAVCVRSLETH